MRNWAKKRTWIFTFFLGIFFVGIINEQKAAAQTKTTAPAPVTQQMKIVRIVVPYAAGGGTDRWARVMARGLEKQLRNVTVIVENVPGAGGVVGTNKAYETVQDIKNITLLASAGGVIASQHLEEPGVRYDVWKMPGIAYDGVSQMGYAHPRTRIVKPVDIMSPATKLRLGSTGSLDPGSAGAAIMLREIFGLDIDIVGPYGGASEQRLGFLQGETNVGFDGAPSYISTIIPTLIKPGNAVSLFQLGMVTPTGSLVRDSSLLPGIPTAGEVYKAVFGRDPTGTAWQVLTFLIATGGKGVMAPPGVPNDVVEALREATRALLQDSVWREELKKIYGSAPSSAFIIGQDVGVMFRGQKIPKESVDWLKQWINKYMK